LGASAFLIVSFAPVVTFRWRTNGIAEATFFPPVEVVFGHRESSGALNLLYS
jgi:hypothetical protein